MKVRTLGLIFKHCNTVCAHFITSYLAAFIFSDYKNLYLPSILHLYHHLFAKLVHLYNFPLYWVCWGHKRLFVIWLQGCLRARPSSTYASHGFINLRSSTWGKFATILQTCALAGPTTSTRRRLRSRHHHAGNNGDHDSTLEMEIKSTRWWWPYHVTYFDCMVVWERPTSSYASHRLINLRSSTWGKLLLSYKTLRLEAQHESTRIKLRSRHQARMTIYGIHAYTIFMNWS